MKKTLYILFILILFVAISTIVADILIQVNSHNKVYNDIYKVPYNRVGLLLGTSKYFQDGSKNLYFKYRIHATVNLYFTGKIDRVLISGDNSLSYYNEPLDMKKALVKKGVPADKIHLDFAGFRTYDSIIRANKVFGLTSYTIITQEYHNQRAIYIADVLGHNAIAYNAKNVNQKYGLDQYFREKLARVKVFIDFMLGIKPKFLGKKIEIE